MLRLYLGCIDLNTHSPCDRIEDNINVDSNDYSPVVPVHAYTILTAYQGVDEEESGAYADASINHTTSAAPLISEYGGWNGGGEKNDRRDT